MPEIKSQVQIVMSEAEIKQACFNWLIQQKHLDNEQDGNVSIAFNSKRALGAHGMQLYATISVLAGDAQKREQDDSS